MSKQRNYENKGPAVRGKLGLFVYGLDQKFRDMGEYLGVGPTRTALATALDFGENTLGDAVKAERCTAELMQRIQNAIKQRYGKVFDPSWPEWRDPDVDPTTPPEKRRDTPQSFLVKLRMANAAKQQHGQAAAPTPRFPVAIAAGQRQEPVHSIAVDLASVAIEGSQYGFGTVAIEITVSCGIWQGATFQKAAIQSGRITLGCSPAAMTLDSFKSWVGKTRTVKNTRLDGSEGPVSLAFGGTRIAPYWRVTGIGGGIGTFWVDADFAAIEDLAPGDKVAVTFGTWLAEIDDTEEAAGGSVILVDDKGQELKVPVEELSKKKRRVISSIRKSILDADPGGYVPLASHALIVVEKK